MPEAKYRALDHLGSTDVSMILNNARKFHLIRGGQLEESKECYELGKAFHVALLEPDKLFDLVAIMPQGANLKLKEVAKRNDFLVAACRGKTAKVYKEMVEDHPNQDVLIEQEAEAVAFFQQNRGRIFVNGEEFNTVQRLVEKAKGVQGFENYLKEGRKEQAYFGEIEGVPVKGRMDIMFTNEDGSVYVFDPKHTGMEATAATFAQMSGSHNYYLQEWLYTEVLRQNGVAVKDYLFLLVSHLEHSGAGYYKHDYSAMERADELVHKAIQKFKSCQMTGEWNEGKFDWSENRFELVSEVTLPTYIFYKYE